MRAPLLALGWALLLLTPPASACHVGAGLDPAAGVVATADGLVPAELRLGGHCEGRVPVVVVLHTRDGPVEDAFHATLTIVPRNGGVFVGPLHADLFLRDRECLFEGCGDFAPSVAFRLDDAEAGVHLAGHVENVHFAVALQLAGSYRAQPAAFAAAVA